VHGREYEDEHVRSRTCTSTRTRTGRTRPGTA